MVVQGKLAAAVTLPDLAEKYSIYAEIRTRKMCSVKTKKASVQDTPDWSLQALTVRGEEDIP